MARGEALQNFKLFCLAEGSIVDWSKTVARNQIQKRKCKNKNFFSDFREDDCEAILIPLCITSGSDVCIS